jgi:Fe-S-cluster-containing dehydrogenase component
MSDFTSELPVSGNCQNSCGSSSPAHGGLIDKLIQSQQQLTAVEQFSQQFDYPLTKPALEPKYRDLIPLDLPGENEQYSFEVDLDACSGCKACVAACHSLNGLDDGELWRNVGMLVGGGEEDPVLQHVTSSCHHCLEPACMHGCPVNAYEKDPITGIVAHLDDQCIGCKYCMFMCPYDVPSYSESKGIVRKCNMCADRLAVGEAPACVQACPHQAIKIRTVSHQEMTETSKLQQLVPGAPDLSLTLATTRYNTNRTLPDNLRPDDYYRTQSLHAHFPLVFMLTLTQMAFGIFATNFFVNQLNADVGAKTLFRIDIFGFLVLVAGLSVAILHLGRPFKAYRAMAGLRTSWLSREILGFNIFASAATGLLMTGLMTGPYLDGIMPDWMRPPQQWLPVLYGVSGVSTTIFGAVAVATSAMLYIVTKRPLWSGFRTSSLFFLTAAILGTASVVVGLVATSMFVTESGFSSQLIQISMGLSKVLMVFVILKLAIEGSIFRHLRSKQFTPHHHAANLMVGQMRWPTIMRYGLLVVGGLLLPLMFVAAGNQSLSSESAGGVFAIAVIGLTLVLIAELLERYLFFAVSVARRMPGAPN